MKYLRHSCGTVHAFFVRAIHGSYQIYGFLGRVASTLPRCIVAVDYYTKTLQRNMPLTLPRCSPRHFILPRPLIHTVQVYTHYYTVLKMLTTVVALRLCSYVACSTSFHLVTRWRRRSWWTGSSFCSRSVSRTGRGRGRSCKVCWRPRKRRRRRSPR